MENGISLSYITRGNSSPRGKSKVYFSYHPQDRGYLEHISSLLLEKQDCAVYYYDYEQLGEPDREKLGALLDEMQLMVILVTSKYLSQENNAFAFEFSYAMDRHIPLLPLLQSSDLAQEFNQKCGNLQFLDENTEDKTAISFEEKLEKYLSDVLISPETTERIQKAFRAYVFLSYRKKDRAHAQKLMRLIHDDPRCRDIAIWYDEFLVAGEPFDTAIMDALSKSDLFTLLVTPNLVNEENYVKQYEYPAAREKKKSIIAAESVPTDRELLQKDFEDVPRCIDAGDSEKIPEEILHKLDIAPQTEDTPEHIYLMGLAYLGGIDVEKNSDMAVSLITAAADSGYGEAMKKLADMFFNGIGVEISMERAAFWQEKYVSLLTEDWQQHLECTPKENLDPDKAETLFCERNLLASYFSEESLTEVSVIELMKTSCFWERGFLSKCFNGSSPVEKAKAAYLDNISFAEELSDLLADKHLYFLAACYNNMGNLYNNHRRALKAGKFYRKAILIYEELAKKNPRRYKNDLAGCCYNASICCLFVFRPISSLRYLLKAKAVLKK